jgi:hypothetical protein
MYVETNGVRAFNSPYYVNVLRLGYVYVSRTNVVII